MGSIASDNQGNIALGFSASSGSINRKFVTRGRLATDPLDTLSGEQHLFDGPAARVLHPIAGAITAISQSILWTIAHLFTQRILPDDVQLQLADAHRLLQVR